VKTVQAFNLFGDPITLQISEARRTPTKRQGYAAIPGTGPAGETCASCAHCRRCGTTSKRYLKCGLMQKAWTHGQGTDILGKSPACWKWERPA
jgi:hypothetical protein